MITKFTIYGERCSGTNYLENLIKENFDLELTWNYGWKHFFGFNNYNNSDDVLFICIVRNPIDWLNSFFREKHHLPDSLQSNFNNFLNDEFYSVNRDKNNIEIVHDRNIYTKKRYKNIFELRNTKLKYLIETLPTLVKNYIFIKYEDLINNFVETMNKIAEFNIKPKHDTFINIFYYKKNENQLYVPKNNENKIIHIPDEYSYYDKLLKYIN